MLQFSIDLSVRKYCLANIFLPEMNSLDKTAHKNIQQSISFEYRPVLNIFPDETQMWEIFFYTQSLGNI